MAVEDTRRQRATGSPWLVEEVLRFLSNGCCTVFPKSAKKAVAPHQLAELVDMLILRLLLLMSIILCCCSVSARKSPLCCSVRTAAGTSWSPGAWFTDAARAYKQLGVEEPLFDGYFCDADELRSLKLAHGCRLSAELLLSGSEARCIQPGLKLG